MRNVTIMSIILIILFVLDVGLRAAFQRSTVTTAPSFSVMPPFAHDVRLHKSDVHF